MLCLRRKHERRLQPVGFRSALSRRTFLSFADVVSLSHFRATKLIARQKEREALNAKAREEEEGEAAGEEGGGIEIEGLADAGEQPEPRPSRRQRSPSESGGEYEEEEEEVVPRRRPIIEIQ